MLRSYADLPLTPARPRKPFWGVGENFRLEPAFAKVPSRSTSLHALALWSPRACCFGAPGVGPRGLFPYPCHSGVLRFDWQQLHPWLGWLAGSGGSASTGAAPHSSRVRGICAGPKQQVLWLRVAPRPVPCGGEPLLLALLNLSLALGPMTHQAPLASPGWPSANLVSSALGWSRSLCPGLIPLPLPCCGCAGSLRLRLRSALRGSPAPSEHLLRAQPLSPLASQACLQLRGTLGAILSVRQSALGTQASEVKRVGRVGADWGATR